MENEYTIQGMTCQGCVAKVKKTLSSLETADEVAVQLDYPQARITTENKPDIRQLKKILADAGNYTIDEIKKAQPSSSNQEKNVEETAAVNLHIYKPLFLIVTFIAGVSLLSQFPFTDFEWMTWMRHFMAGFFIVFSFFKLLNLKGFADSYSMYDIIAGRFYGWGYIYPFIELALGILYLTNVSPFATNIATALILGVSSIGVIESNLNKKKIKCACLGDVFNLPMSTITIVEDLTMVGMAVIMLI